MKTIMITLMLITFFSCQNSEENLPVVSSPGEQFIDHEQCEFFIEEQIAKAVEKIPDTHKVPKGLKVKKYNYWPGY